ncbi:hypothetical protein GN244_ATG03999 [Phytophthora infestans]|uniref:Uncharacterized protein n=1 Tax=Phytophthora infestans TaxID=4787 RepID=A0A833WZL7_PHYIN|nr:hypothetical protein GN244_ATG03999 [Phytophthora infestans]
MQPPYAVPVDDVAKVNANAAEVVVTIPAEELKPDRDPSGILLGEWEAPAVRTAPLTASWQPAAPAFQWRKSLLAWV